MDLWLIYPALVFLHCVFWVLDDCCCIPSSMLCEKQCDVSEKTLSSETGALMIRPGREELVELRSPPARITTSAASLFFFFLVRGRYAQRPLGDDDLGKKKVR